MNWFTVITAAHCALHDLIPGKPQGASYKDLSFTGRMTGQPSPAFPTTNINSASQIRWAEGYDQGKEKPHPNEDVTDFAALKVGPYLSIAPLSIKPYTDQGKSLNDVEMDLPHQSGDDTIQREGDKVEPYYFDWLKVETPILRGIQVIDQRVRHHHTTGVSTDPPHHHSSPAPSDGPEGALHLQYA